MSLFDNLFAPKIKSRNELLSLIKEAAQDGIFDIDGLPFIDAVLQFGDMRVKDVLLPRHEVDFIDVDATNDEIIKIIQETRHSRFPVVEENLNEIVGVFHSKDIVNYLIEPDSFKLIDFCRKAFFVPELKPLDSLLYEMRLQQIHLAIVVDEFTNVIGIVTLEMIIEQIIGEIDDEHDLANDEHVVLEISPNVYRIKGFCSLEQLREKVGITWRDDNVETIGGYIIKKLGKIPAIAEQITVNGVLIEVLHADSKKINSVIIRL
jgi:Mg2+/Co2+ transporter CorC